jgi:hypothetical protein
VARILLTFVKSKNGLEVLMILGISAVPLDTALADSHVFWLVTSYTFHLLGNEGAVIVSL